MGWENRAQPLDPKRRADEVRLLAEAGFLTDARIEAGLLRQVDERDPEAIGLEGHLSHRVGAISAALRSWKTLHEISPQTHLAVMRLATLREEEKRFPASSDQDLPLVRRALRHVTSGQLDRALALCRDGRRLLASGAPREEQKLLVLLESLILELSGRFFEAADVLERLGRIPAFAHDLDRLALLARLRESARDREGLLAAERVLDFLAGTGKLSAFWRLSSIRHSLGDHAGAQRAEEGYEEAFRRRMHWLTPAERLAALENRTLPLSRIAKMVLPPLDEISARLPRGIVLLSKGRFDVARRVLSTCGGGWKAVSLLAAGEAEPAAHEAAAALTSGGRLDGPLSCVFAEALARAPRATVSEEVVALARASLERTVSVGRPDEEALSHLAFLEARLGRGEAAKRHLARLRAIRRSPWPPPGVVRAAAIYALPGKPKGLVHDVIARRFPAGALQGGRLLEEEIHGALAPESKAQIRQTFAAVRDWLLATHPEAAEEVDSFAYGIHVTKEDEPSGGPSIGLPVAMAFLSSMLQLRVPSRYVFTGALSYDCAGKIAVLPVGDLGIKLKGALHAGARTLVLPASQREEATNGAFVPERIALRSVALVESIDDALGLFASSAERTGHREELEMKEAAPWRRLLLPLNSLERETFSDVGG